VGELAALAAAAAWAFASVLWTRLGAEYDEIVLNLLKCTLATVMLSGALMALQGTPWPIGMHSYELFWLVVSGIVGLTIGDSAYFHALTRIGPRRALLVWAMAPGISAALAWPVLGEPIDLRMVLGMTTTLGGVVWVILENQALREQDERDEQRERASEVGGAPPKGAGGGLSRKELVGLAFAGVALIGQGSANVLVKLGGEGFGALEVSVVRLAAGAAGLGIWLGALRRLSGALPPLKTPRTLGWILLATLVGTFAGIWLCTYGLLHADVGVAATLNSTSPLFVLPLAVVMQGERVSPRAIAGAFVAVSGVAIFFLA
jgi:drug/metabolite transporter (DMT)-like permease